MISIPNYGKICRNEIELRSEVDYYGCSHMLAALAGMSVQPPRSFASWAHGWRGTNLLKFPAQLIMDNSKSNLNILVHTKYQERFLRSHGFSNAHAVGIPFAYAWRHFKGPRKKAGSLLVLPPHMTERIDIEYDESCYVEQINAIANGFEDVTVCITAACYKHLRWEPPFRKAGYNVVIGGDLRDANSILRSFSLFSEFEYVTSPSLGSHIVYAALCGCKVSIFGSLGDISPPRAIVEKHPYFQKHPYILEFIYSAENFQYKRRVEERFQCNPVEAEMHLEWAKNEAGVACMLPVQALVKLLGWNKPKLINYANAFSRMLFARCRHVSRI